MRRRLLLVLWLTALTLQSFATAQEADVVYVDGIAYALLARPIVQNETLFQSLQGLVDKEKGSRTSNWDGFKGYWTIANGQLLLDSVGYVSKKDDGYAMLDTRSFNRISSMGTWLPSGFRAPCAMEEATLCAMCTMVSTAITCKKRWQMC